MTQEGTITPKDVAQLRALVHSTHFFALNRDHLRRVSVLVGSQVVHLTVAIAQHLSRTGDLIQIYSDPETFAARVGSTMP